MDKIFKNFFIYFILLTSVLIAGTSCGVGTGCPAQQGDSTKFDRKGKLKGTGGKTRLFPKNMKK
ncbi:MAG TPA: hypothetical protein PKM27_17455 [Saprospiraceae bacterium]|nr:hypothetical protein [Saprospiraceae bacterium]HNT20213.1 hypothetical protein [Saprospiraceae bacterium]